MKSGCVCVGGWCEGGEGRRRVVRYGMHRISDPVDLQFPVSEEKK